MPEYDLKLTLKKLGAKHWHFALYRGEKENQILVTSRQASVQLVNEMEEEHGDTKRIAKGLVYYHGSTLVFATEKDPAPSWTKHIKEVLKEAKYATYKDIAVRKLTKDDRADEEEAE